MSHLSTVAVLSDTMVPMRALLLVAAALGTACGDDTACLCAPGVETTFTTPSGHWRAGRYELRASSRGDEAALCTIALPELGDAPTLVETARCPPSGWLRVERLATAGSTTAATWQLRLDSRAGVDLTASVRRDGVLLVEQTQAITGLGPCDCGADPLTVSVPADRP